jgi:excisionase family DNA binding protein
VSSTTNKDENNIEDWISQAEAARIRGVSKQAIAKLIARNRLSAHEIGGRMLVRRSEVEAFVPMPIGRPRKKAAAKKQTTPKKKKD